MTVCGFVGGVGRRLLGLPRLSPYCLHSLTAAEYFFDDPETQVALGFVAVICVGYQRLLRVTAGIGSAARLNQRVKRGGQCEAGSCRYGQGCPAL